MISWFRFVTHDSVEDYLAKGWVIADTLFGTKHGDFAVLMRFAGEGEPK